MLRCVDTFSEIPALFPKGVFELAAWRAYAQTHFGKDASLFEDDMNDWADDFEDDVDRWADGVEDWADGVAARHRFSRGPGICLF